MFAGLQVTLGLGYTFGSEETDRYITLDDVADQDEFLIDAATTKVNFSRLKLIVGFGVRT